MDLTFEMNPLNKENIDQLISAVFQPLEIIYDAVRILSFVLICFFLANKE